MDHCFVYRKILPSVAQRRENIHEVVPLMVIGNCNSQTGRPQTMELFSCNLKT